MIQRILNPAKALRTLRKTHALLLAALQGTTQAQAQTLRDGPDGWSVLLIACHLRDYETALAERVTLLLTADQPVFTPWDQVALVERHHYAEQNLHAVLHDLAACRAELIERLEALPDAAWLRAGTHPEQGPGTLLDVAINAGLHDIDHLEQITRCLA